MRIDISKVGNIVIAENNISVSVVCSGQDLRVNDVTPSAKCLLLLGSEKISCMVSSLTKKKDGSYGFTLKTNNNFKLLSLLYPYHHKNSLDGVLLIQENVPVDMYQEAERLLRTLSDLSGKKQSDILFEISSFKDVKGKRNLRFISINQMPVVIDKAKELIKKLSQEEAKS